MPARGWGRPSLLRFLKRRRGTEAKTEAPERQSRRNWDKDTESPERQSRRRQHATVHGTMAQSREWRWHSSLVPPAPLAPPEYEQLGTFDEDAAMEKLQTKREEFENHEVMQQEAQRKLFAKRHIIQATSGQDLFFRAENTIEEDWLGRVDEMPGNIYRIMAFGAAANETVTYAFSEKALRNLATQLGFFAILLLQWIGPPSIFLSTVFSWGIMSDQRITWEKWHPSLSDWHHIGLTRFLSTMFMFCLCLNCLFVILDEKSSWKKIDDIFRYLQVRTPQFELRGEFWLWLGACTNCWVVLWCCVDSLVVIGRSDSPKECCSDALGLLFLYNLDDIGGDLGFVDRDNWPGLKLGWIYEEMVQENFAEEESQKADFDPENNTEFAHNLLLGVYSFTAALVAGMAVCLPLFSAITPWREIDPGR
eukprot:TRINITY_DN57369_c0_g1_i1.p1 TRINITY_DN57369_c0_g1~~TRINITY_DN57369_c0_g1_i1.p1  ORF type:complete len:421 (-),score=75.60 TRINITY_DN57369_c0_g1_i1:23-1285(-)